MTLSENVVHALGVKGGRINYNQNKKDKDYVMGIPSNATSFHGQHVLRDSLQSPTHNSTIKNKDIPNYHSFTKLNEKNGAPLNAPCNGTEGQNTITKKRSMTILLKPSPWSARWRNCLDFLLRRSKNDKSSNCSNCRLSNSILMVLGALVFFILIVVAYFLGRFLSNHSDCTPTNQTFKNVSLLRGHILNSNKMNRQLTPIVRLARYVIPVHYNAQFDLTDLRNHKIKGTVRIFIDCIISTNVFVLHSSHKHISILKLSISQTRSKEIIKWTNWRKTNVTLGGDGYSTLAIKLDTNLLPGSRYQMTIVYSAQICNDQSGVSCYEESHRGHSEVYLATKFEPTSARTVMPCFDEPDMKATFNVSIVKYSDMHIITNMPLLKRTKARHGRVIDHFETTPRMSTYLLGLIAGPYARQEKVTDRGTRVAVWTRREDRPRGDYALDYGIHMLQLMEEYFSINYPLSKLDFVASPSYPVGAMENWGLLIFHQRALLYTDEYRLIGDKSSGANQGYHPHLLPKFHVSKIIIHELVHQWFGNLVTMHWWSEIWLNEGFATFFIYHFLKADYPLLADFHQTWKLIDAWQRQTIFVQQFHNNLKIENFTLVRNFSYDEDIFDAFDEYNLYAKGGSIVRMLWYLLGESSMQLGLKLYLEANKYRSVDRWELWKRLEYSMPDSEFYNASDTGILGKTMESWLTNPGFPEVTIRKTASYGSNTGVTFQLYQNMADSRLHCAYLTKTLIQHNKQYLWSIPFSYQIGDTIMSNELEQGRSFLLNNRSHTFIVSSITSHHWILANPDFHFPYRVNYDLDNWSKLIRQLREFPNRIPARSRAQLISDASFFLKGTNDFPYFLDLLGYLNKETELLPLILGLREIHQILDTYKASSIYSLLIFYFRPIIDQASNMRVISESDPELDAIWWLDDSYTLNLKLLQCITRHRRCYISREEVQSILSLPNTGPLTDKLIPICEYLRRNFSEMEAEILKYWLDQQYSSDWRQDITYMVTCVYDKRLIKQLINVTLARGDLEFLATSLSSTFTLNYNDLLTIELWSQLGNATVSSSIDSTSTEMHLKNMIRSVRTLGELELARRAFRMIGIDFEEEIDFVESKLNWHERNMAVLQDWLMQKVGLT